MTTVTIQLKTPWPTDAGLRRPAEGPISFSEAEAARILKAKAGVPVGDKSKGKGKPSASEPEKPVDPE